ncbi:MAG TPA: hypothetical protein VFE11_20075 [Dongiaceae bacterium]|jgi:hypothetical protein|nr:hypothetical protein [Dongiaceae bacterium]
MLGKLTANGMGAALAALLLAAGLAGGSAPAAAAAPYEVTGVPVDVTAADSATARDEALAQGQRKAFDQLIQQLVGADKAPTIRQPSDSELSGMVQDLEVESEKVSSVRYIGVLTYRFAADPINALIGKPTEGAMVGGVPGTATPPAPSGPVRGITVDVPITSLQDWLQVQRRLTGVPALQRVIVRYLARDGGMLDLSYTGDEAALTAALAQRHLSLTQVEQQWVLQLGAPPASGEPTGTP